jgi:hypothetical protein
MNVLKINKSNITSAEYNQLTQEWIDTDIKELSFPFTRYFSQVIELSNDLTIEDLMKHLRNYSDVIDFCFYSYLNGVSIKEYCDLAEKEPVIKSIVDTIELYWATELNEDEYCLFGTFHGIVTKEEELAKIKDINLNSFKMDLTPINEWKHCTIILDETLKASAGTDDGHENIVKLKNRWTLFDLLQYFLFDITFFGSVEQQKKEIEDFDAAQKKYDGFRVDPEFANNLTQEELITFIAEIKKQIVHNGALLEDAVDSEDFLVAQNLKQEDSDLREELGKMKKRLKELKNQNE